MTTSQFCIGKSVYRPSFVKKLLYHFNLYRKKKQKTNKNKKIKGLSKSGKTMNLGLNISPFPILQLSVLNNSKSKKWKFVAQAPTYHSTSNNCARKKLSK